MSEDLVQPGPIRPALPSEVAPPSVSPIPREARPYQGHRAGIVTRMVAAVIDTGVVAAIILAGYGALIGGAFILSPRDLTVPNPSLLFSLTTSFFVAVLYLTVGWSINGRTYGCHVMALRVVSFRGQRLRPTVALLRALFCVGFPIGLFWCAGSRANRSIQDVVLRSSVVYDWRPASPWRKPRGPRESSESSEPSGPTLAGDDLS